MNFERQQARVRQKSFSLFLLLVAAVVANALMVYGIAALAYKHEGYRGQRDLFDLTDPYSLRFFLYACGASAAVMLFATLREWFALARSGDGLAQSLGAVSILPDTRDPDERRLVNVVEEMSIASGVPVPFLFRLPDQPGINAFVAGTAPDNAVLCVTDGCMQKLTREELTGVIAHEYSHILNEDMRINHRLIAYFSGLLALRGWGFALLRGSGARGRRRGGGLVLALPLLLMGTVGYFFALLIGRAISRQRELLADAFAVEFTRQPEGLASALRKILWNDAKGVVRHDRTAAIAPLLFADGIKRGFGGWFSTHPPLETRIAAIAPGLLRPERPRLSADPTGPRAAPAAGPSFVHFSYARAFVENFPDGLARACRDLRGAQDVLLQLIAPAPTGPDIAALGPGARLPVFYLCVGTLRSLGLAEKNALHRRLEDAARADGKISYSEWLLLSLARKHLFADGTQARVEFRRIDGLESAIRDVLGAVARLAGTAAPPPPAAWERATQVLGRSIPREPWQALSIESLTASVERLRRASESIRREVLQAVADLAIDDGKLRGEEAEFLRALADLFDAPIPPIPPDRLKGLAFPGRA